MKSTIVLLFLALFLSLFLACLCLQAQQTPAPGTVTQATSSVITATAGGLVCSFTRITPDTKTDHVKIACSSNSGSTMTQDTTGTTLIQAQFAAVSDVIAWDIAKAATGELFNWSVTANGATKTGTF